MLDTKEIPVDIPNSVITNDQLCSLGHWLHSERMQGSDLDELKKIHKDFHLLAGECVAYCEMGNYQTANEKRNELHIVSGQVISMLKIFNTMIWTEDYSVGIEELDRQHRKLFELINKLSDHTVELSSLGEKSDILNELISYAIEHLEYEESLLTEHGYPETDNHKEKHAHYLEKFNALLKDSKSGEEVFSDDLVSFLQNWWRHHVLEEDMKYKPFFAEKGIS